jgi:hypothetical protein
VSTFLFASFGYSIGPVFEVEFELAFLVFTSSVLWRSIMFTSTLAVLTASSKSYWLGLVFSLMGHSLMLLDRLPPFSSVAAVTAPLMEVFSVYFLFFFSAF